MQKCGSHVVENILRRAPQHKRDQIIDELMSDPKLLHTMVDQFDNFVIQIALEHCGTFVVISCHRSCNVFFFLFK
jgi:hypothetical protein